MLLQEHEEKEKEALYAWVNTLPKVYADGSKVNKEEVVALKKKQSFVMVCRTAFGKIPRIATGITCVIKT